ASASSGGTTPGGSPAWQDLTGGGQGAGRHSRGWSGSSSSPPGSPRSPASGRADPGPRRTGRARDAGGSGSVDRGGAGGCCGAGSVERGGAGGGCGAETSGGAESSGGAGR